MKNLLTKIIFVILGIITVLVWREVAKSPEANGKDIVELYFFNVGQGDSELIQRNDFQILIDGGPDSTILQKLGETMPLFDRKIEILILSHPHADHIQGINQVLERYQVDEIYYSDINYDSNAYDEFKNKINENGIKNKIPNIGDEINPFNNAYLTFLWPGSKYSGQTIGNINDSSEVVRFCYFENCALYPGDLEITGQKTMLNEIFNSQQDIKSNILKLAHHGSNNGTDQNIIDAVEPKYAVISVGEGNKYGHPMQSVLDLLMKNNIENLRTDRLGDIKFLFTSDSIIKK